MTEDSNHLGGGKDFDGDEVLQPRWEDLAETGEWDDESEAPPVDLVRLRRYLLATAISPDAMPGKEQVEIWSYVVRFRSWFDALTRLEDETGLVDGELSSWEDDAHAPPVDKEALRAMVCRTGDMTEQHRRLWDLVTQFRCWNRALGEVTNEVAEDEQGAQSKS